MKQNKHLYILMALCLVVGLELLVAPTVWASLADKVRYFEEDEEWRPCVRLWKT